MAGYSMFGDVGSSIADFLKIGDTTGSNVMDITGKGFDWGGMFSDVGKGISNNKDLIGGLVGTGADLYSNRKSRKSEQDRFNKMFDFNKDNVQRTNRLEDERQSSIDKAYGSSQNFNF